MGRRTFRSVGAFLNIIGHYRRPCGPRITARCAAKAGRLGVPSRKEAGRESLAMCHLKSGIGEGGNKRSIVKNAVFQTHLFQLSLE